VGRSLGGGCLARHEIGGVDVNRVGRVVVGRVLPVINSIRKIIFGVNLIQRRMGNHMGTQPQVLLVRHVHRHKKNTQPEHQQHEEQREGSLFPISVFSYSHGAYAEHSPTKAKLPQTNPEGKRQAATGVPPS
jgi:hypothetical protein